MVRGKRGIGDVSAIYSLTTNSRWQDETTRHSGLDAKTLRRESVTNRPRPGCTKRRSPSWTTGGHDRLGETTIGRLGHDRPTRATIGRTRRLFLSETGPSWATLPGLLAGSTIRHWPTIRRNCEKTLRLNWTWDLERLWLETGENVEERRNDRNESSTTERGKGSLDSEGRWWGEGKGASN